MSKKESTEEHVKSIRRAARNNQGVLIYLLSVSIFGFVSLLVGTGNTEEIIYETPSAAYQVVGDRHLTAAFPTLPLRSAALRRRSTRR